MGFLFGGVAGVSSEALNDKPPRIGDGSVQGSGTGVGINVQYGKGSIGGNVIWHSPVSVVTKSEDVIVGKDKSVTIHTYHYYISIALLIGVGPVDSVRQLLANGVAYFDREYSYKSGITFYEGNETQLPDPTIESFEGVGNVPAFRGMSYIVLTDYKLYEGKQAQTSLSLPVFTLVVDGKMSTIHNYDIERPGIAYNLRNYMVDDSVGVYEPFYTPFAPTTPVDVALAGHPWIRGPVDNSDSYVWDNGLTQLSYDQIVADAYAWRDVADTIDPKVFEVSVIGQSVNGLDIVCVSIFDDGNKPVIGFSNGIHGDEREVAKAITQIYRYIVTNGKTSSDPWLANACNTHAFIFVLTVNPDGMANPVTSSHGGTGTRENANLVNLNRNWPYFWDYTSDPDKGSSAASEPETQAIMAWLLNNQRVKRVVAWLDCHGWNSRTAWGLLQEQIYHDPIAQNTQRSVLMYANKLIKSRDWSAVDLVNGVPELTEYRSHHKSYLYTWVRNQCRQDGWAGLLEYPQSENTLSVNLVFFDIFRAMCMAACDLAQPSIGTFHIGREIPPPLNQNVFFTSWVESEQRPAYYSISGLKAVHFPARLNGLEPRSFVRLTRPKDSSWPVQFYGAAYSDGGPFSCATVVGGENIVGKSQSINTEYESNPIPTQGSSYPEKIVSAAGCSDGLSMYVSGGSTDTTFYSDAIRKINYPDTESKLLFWSDVGTLPNGIQRHTMNYWNGNLIVAGGRTADGYTSDVVAYNLSIGESSVIASLSSARGWHTATVSGDYLYVFGGWSGTNTLTSCEKINLVTGIRSSIASLPNSRAEQALAHDKRSNVVYLAFGRTGSSYKNNIYMYDIASDVMTEWNLTIVAEDEFIDGEVVADPIDSGELIGAAAWINEKEDLLVIAGGKSSIGTFSDRVWEADLVGTSLFQRKTSNLRWGYIRPSSAFYGIAGDQFTVLASVRNADDVNDVTNPYVRLTVYIGPASNPTRKIRLGYTVPPQDKYGLYTYQIPFSLHEGESEFRVYLRLYSGGTTVDVGCFQVVKTMSACAPVPVQGRQADAYQVTWRETINSPSAADQPVIRHYNEGVVDESLVLYYSDEMAFYFTADFTFTHIYNGHITGTNLQKVSGIFSPTWGCQMTHNTQIFEFVMLEGLEFDGFELWFESIESAPTPDPYTGMDSFEPNGRLYIKKRINGSWQEQTLMSGVPLNHSRLNREFRRDIFYWELMSYRLKASFTISFYGQVSTVNFDGLSFVCFGLQSVDSGVFMRASRNLSLILADICRRSGLADDEFDVSAVTGEVTGYLAGNRSSATSLIDPLKTAFNFDVSDTDKLRFKPRNPIPVRTIDVSELIQKDSGAPYKINRRQESELPNKVSVVYIDADKNFEQNAQYVARVAGVGHGEKTVSLPIVMDSTKSAQIADTLLFNEWVNRTSSTLRLGYENYDLEAGDTFILVDGSKTFTFLITSINDNGSSLECEVVEADGTILSSNATGSTGAVPIPQIATYADSQLFTLDIPCIRDADSDSGFYYAVSRNTLEVGRWQGARVSRSQDGGSTWLGLTLMQNAAPYGIVSGSLSAPNRFTVWDDASEITVVMRNGQLSSFTKDEVLQNLSNLAVIGEEVVIFATATLIAPNTYTLSNFLRGMYGTEDKAYTHSAGETLVKLGLGWVARYDAGLNDLHVPRKYRAATVYTDETTVEPSDFVNTGRALRPYSVANLQAVEQADESVIVSWVRRSRIGGGWNNGAEVPLGELDEKYEVDIINPSTNVVVKTVLSNVQSITYSAAARVSDFGSSSTPVRFEVFQMSGSVGRGIKSTIEI